MDPPRYEKDADALSGPPEPVPDRAAERARLAEDLAWLVLRRLRRLASSFPDAPGDARGGAGGP
jgi:hypothetical protein